MSCENCELFWRLKTLGLFLRKYVVFSDFDETWPEYSSDINAHKSAML